MTNQQQSTTHQGLAEIVAHEGIVTSPYKDSVGVWTIGIGHVIRDEERNLPPSQFSISDIIRLFLADIAQCEERVRDVFTIPLSSSQFDAAVSFDFNTGAIHRASWVQHVNARKFTCAQRSFMLWKKPAEIIPRRRKEFDLFFHGIYHASGLVTLYPATSQGKVLWKYGKEHAFSHILSQCSSPSSSLSHQTNPQNTVPLPHILNPDNRHNSQPVDALPHLDPVPPDPPMPGLESSHTKQLPPLLPNSTLSQEDSLDISSIPILPLFRPRLPAHLIHRLFTLYSDLTPTQYRGDPVKILMIRGFFMDQFGPRGYNHRACYDDAVFVLSPDGVQSFNGNTDPSVFRQGIATIKAPQAIHYIPGMHGYARPQGPYPAFRQHAPCTVLRDGQGEDTGIFALNLHAGSLDDVQSAGCLTIPRHQWDEFFSLVSRLLQKYKQKTFHVTLIIGSEDHIRNHRAPSLAGLPGFLLRPVIAVLHRIFH